MVGGGVGWCVCVGGGGERERVRERASKLLVDHIWLLQLRAFVDAHTRSLPLSLSSQGWLLTVEVQEVQGCDAA